MYRSAALSLVIWLLIVPAAFAKLDPVTSALKYRPQGNTATCWLQCGTSTLDQQAGIKFGRPVTFSSDAILLQDLRSRGLAKFLRVETPWDPGAGMTRALALSLEHGLIPENVWKSRTPIQQNEATITATLDKVIAKAHADGLTRAEFVRAMDEELLKFVGRFPPSEFYFLGKETTARLLALDVIEGDAMAYEFHPEYKYNGEVFGMVSDEAWSHIISQFGEWITITHVLGKQLHIMSSPDAALEKAVEIHEEGRPLFFTFIYFDDDGQVTFRMDGDKYVATRPPRTSYSSSHFLFVTRLERDRSKNLSGFWVRDSVSSVEKERFVSVEFAKTLGKTFHTIGTPCESLLVGTHRFEQPK